MKKLSIKAQKEATKVARTAISNHTSGTKQELNYNNKKESITTVKAILLELYTLLDLDTDKLHGSTTMARKSEYGRIPEMLSKIASIYAWPIDDIADIKEISEKQEEILDYFKGKLDGDLLLDLKESKGNHSFLDKTSYEIIPSNEPEYEDYEFLIYKLAGNLDLTYVDFKLNEDKWERNELKAQESIAIEQHAAELALKAHEDLMAGKTA